MKRLSLVKSLASAIGTPLPGSVGLFMDTLGRLVGKNSDGTTTVLGMDPTKAPISEEQAIEFNRMQVSAIRPFSSRETAIGKNVNGYTEVHCAAYHEGGFPTKIAYKVVSSDPGGPEALKISFANGKWGQLIIDPDTISVVAFGARCDLRPLQRAAITAGSDILTCSDAVFKASDVGKPIGITGAGAAGAQLVGTIIAVNSPTQCRLSVNASTTVDATTGFKSFVSGVVTQNTARAFYGTDDRAAIQLAIDTLHPLFGVIRIPAPGCLILNTLYVQTSSITGSVGGLLYRRLLFQGTGFAIQSGLVGNASEYDSNLFCPNNVDMIRVNLNAAGVGMTSPGGTPTHQYYNFGVENIAFHGLNGSDTVAMRLHRVRATLRGLSFNNLACGWEALDPDANGALNYSDQWDVWKIAFNNCKRGFRQRDADACVWDRISGESWHPDMTVAFEIFGGRGWEIRGPLINQVPATGKIGLFYESREGKVVAGHFEQIYGNAFTINGSNSGTFVDITHCDFFNSHTATLGAMTLDTIKYSGASGTVARCGFSHNRSAGYDINFASGRWQQETDNQFFGADNLTRRTPSINIVVAGGNGGNSFRQKYFLNVIRLAGGNNFDLRNTGGASVLSQIFSGNPAFNPATGELNLDGSALWGRPNKAVVIRKVGKYEPRLVDVAILKVSFYDDAGNKIMVADDNMEFWLEVE